ncbi:hypothetical protein, partial [Mariniphaga sp.]|uniref:hypothetical protein n=1 Tax=Mariniphaga sp. TaxID=1954475 RepID=UPI00356477A8
MKKNIILFLSLLLVINVIGQYPTNQPEIKNYGYYYSKYKTQATTGKIFCAGGTILAVVGAVGVAHHGFPFTLSPNLPIYATDLERLKESWYILLD